MYAVSLPSLYGEGGVFNASCLAVCWWPVLAPLRDKLKPLGLELPFLFFFGNGSNRHGTYLLSFGFLTLVSL